MRRRLTALFTSSVVLFVTTGGTVLAAQETLLSKLRASSVSRRTIDLIRTSAPRPRRASIDDVEVLNAILRGVKEQACGTGHSAPPHATEAPRLRREAAAAPETEDRRLAVLFSLLEGSGRSGSPQSAVRVVERTFARIHSLLEGDSEGGSHAGAPRKRIEDETLDVGSI